MGVIGAGLGGLAGGLLGGLFGGGSQPELKMPAQSPEMDYNLRFAKKRAEATPQEIAQGLKTDTDVGAHLLGDTSDLNRQSSALGMANREDMNRVLQDRGSKAYDSDLNALQRQISNEALMKRNKREQDFSAINQEMRAIAQSASQAVDEAQAARQAARNQVIVSLFSSAGTLVGAGLGQSAGKKPPAEWTPKMGENMFDTGYQSKNFGMIGK